MEQTIAIEERRWGHGAIDLGERTLPSLKAQRALKEIVNLPSEAKVLDYGCGEGKLLATIAHQRSDLQLYGADIQKPLSKHLPFEFALLENNETFPLDIKYDRILSLDVLEHVPDLEKALASITQILKDDGKFMVFVPMEGEPFSPFGFYRWILGADIYVRTKSHIQAYSKKYFMEIFEKHFVIEEISYSYHVLGTLLDSTFFALCSLRSLAKWFWKENSIYHPENKKNGLLNRLMEWANWLCYHESKIMRSNSTFASGLHIIARKK